MSRRKTADRPLFDRCSGAQRGYDADPLFDPRPDDAERDEALEDPGIARLKRIHAKLKEEESND